MEKLNRILDLFLNQKTGSEKLQNDSVIVSAKNALIVRQYHNEDIREEIVAIRLDSGVVLGNSSLLPVLSEAMGAHDFRGKRGETAIQFQQVLGNRIPMIPFAMFKQAGLKVSSYRELDKGNEETVFVNESIQKYGLSKESLNEFIEKLKSEGCIEVDSLEKSNSHREDEYSLVGQIKRPRHFTGARLFNIGDDTFLLDIDRIEIGHGIFNPFLVKLSKPCKTISGAYLSLKPEAVSLAEKQGLKVLRQGEWFFIPSDLVPISFETHGYLRAGRNRPNVAEFFNEDQLLVKGEISHSGREHKTILLETWHQAIANTSVESWQLSGDID